jgi:hypothetical protein
MALFITLGLISRPSAKMLSLAQHLSVYAVSCTVGINFDTLFRLRKSSVVLDIETIEKPNKPRKKICMLTSSFSL